MRVLIVGCGYVGQRLAKYYLEHGDKVWALQRGKVEIPGIININADVATLAENSLPPVDMVFYLVAADSGDSADYQRAYVSGIAHVLAALSQPPQKIIYVSSTAVYGQQAGEWVDEETPALPRSEQGKILLAGEDIVNQSGLPHIVVRFGGIYGPGRDRLIRSVIEGTATLTPTPCYTNRIHVDDCAKILHFLAALPIIVTPILGVDNEPVLYNTLLNHIAQQFHAPMLKMGEHIPARLQLSHKRCRNQKILSLGYKFLYPNYKSAHP